ncbi:hypothetical protein LguiA_010520 [Lonicera macranthoides]
MTRLFRSKSERSSSSNNAHYAFDERTPISPSLYLSNEEEEEEEEDDEEDEEYFSNNPITTPFISPDRRREGQQSHQFPVLAVLVAALRKSIVTCGVEADDVSSIDIGSPTNVQHVSHVTFDRFNGFLGLPVELQPDVPLKVPSASVSVFGVSAKSMQCSHDQRGNSVPTILLMMQKRLYSEGGLKSEGIFRITAENGQEQYVRKQLNRGFMPHGVDVNCLAGLIKAWFRELPTGVLDSLSPEQVMHCNTEEDCALLAKSLPQTEASLLDWAINLMADVVQYEHLNKMNARNIAMVFAPNMTQMADPLTALIHAVQVMNFLKTLIMRTLRERESNTPVFLLSPCKDSLSSYGNTHSSNPDEVGSLDSPETEREENCWSFQSKSDAAEEYETLPGENSPLTYKERSMEGGFKDGYGNGEVEGVLDRLNFRKRVRKLCSRPVFQLARSVKKSGDIGIVNT